MNKLVKRILGTILAERRFAGRNLNWTELLGSVAAAINSQCGRCKNDLSAYEAVYGDKFDHPMFCSKSEARHCWTVSERIKVTKEPDFEQFCQQNYFIIDCDDNNKEEDANVDDDYFSDDELPPHETNEVADEWLFSHLMDDMSTIASDKSSWQSGKNAITDDVDANAEANPKDNEEMVEEVDHNFVVDNYVGQIKKDSIEALPELPGLLSTDSLHETVTTGLSSIQLLD